MPDNVLVGYDFGKSFDNFIQRSQSPKFGNWAKMQKGQSMQFWKLLWRFG